MNLYRQKKSTQLLKEDPDMVLIIIVVGIIRIIMMNMMIMKAIVTGKQIGRAHV